MPFYLTPKQDDFNKIPELQALYDVDSIVADPGAYTKDELATLHSKIVSNLERASAQRSESVESGGSRAVTQIMEPSIQWPESGSK